MLEFAANDGAAQDMFGTSVAIHGNTVIVGADGDNGNGDSSGSAYIFVRDASTDSWSQQAKLLPIDEAAYDLFGGSVAIYEDTVIVGAIGNDDNGSASGSAFIFVRDVATNNWSQQAKLLPYDGWADDRFGYSVAIYKNTVIVGAWKDDDNGLDSGSAYIFVRDESANDWSEQPNCRPMMEQLGISLAPVWQSMKTL